MAAATVLTRRLSNHSAAHRSYLDLLEAEKNDIIQEVKEWIADHDIEMLMLDG
jgi:hypothetical protein